MAGKPNFPGMGIGQTIGQWVWNGSSWYDTSDVGDARNASPGGYSVGGGDANNLISIGPTSGGIPIGNNSNRLMDLPGPSNFNTISRPVPNSSSADNASSGAIFGPFDSLCKAYANRSSKINRVFYDRRTAGAGISNATNFYSSPTLAANTRFPAAENGWYFDGAFFFRLSSSGLKYPGQTGLEAAKNQCEIKEDIPAIDFDITLNILSNPKVDFKTVGGIEVDGNKQHKFNSNTFARTVTLRAKSGAGTSSDYYSITRGERSETKGPTTFKYFVVDIRKNGQPYTTLSSKANKTAVLTYTLPTPKVVKPNPILATDYNIALTLYDSTKGGIFTISSASSIKNKISGPTTLNLSTSNFASRGVIFKPDDVDTRTANDSYSIRREQEKITGGFRYVIIIEKNGAFHSRITSNNATASLPFSFNYKAVIPKTPKGIGVNVELEAPNSIVANVKLNNSTVRIPGSTDGGTVNDDNADTANLSATLSGKDSTCSYGYELYNTGGKLLKTSSSSAFNYNGLSAGSTYILKISVSKTEKPDLPPPTGAVKYRQETYYVDKDVTRGAVAIGPLSVVTKADTTQTIINFGDGVGNGKISINFSSTNADYVNFTFGKKVTKLDTSGAVEIDESELLNGAGNYVAYFQAISINDGSGNIVPIKFTAVRKDLLPGPDITTIEYPKLITGKDYQGYNVDFNISWTSINTNYVDIYINEVIDSKKLASKRSPDGNQEFNIKSILQKAGDTLREDALEVVFYLKLIPYNEEGDSKVAGKTETIQIVFDKGNIILRRNDVLDDIKESICTLFDDSVLGSDSSKYLTHLMHFGEADNKVIASWDIDRETFSKYDFDPDTGERFKTHEEETLVFKLYEPLDRAVQPNQQIWVSKIQSIPYVEQITLVNEEIDSCIELTPNFGTDVCGQNIGYQLYDDLIASGSTSSTKLLTEYVSGSGFDLKKLDLNFVSSSREVSGSIIKDGEQSWGWGEFVKYSSAEERVENFMYKIGLIEFYQDKITKLQSGSLHTGSITLQNEINRNSSSIQQTTDGFDAFETFLYTSSSLNGLTYPGAGTSNISSSDSSDSISWYDSIIYSAKNYDKYNEDYLANNLPKHVQSSVDSDQFTMFFNMMGHHFDILYSYTKAIAQKKNIEHKYNIGIKDSLLSEMLKSLSWDAKIPAKAQSLWEYAFGETSDGDSSSSMTGKEIQNQIWRRLLNNLPYLLKHKGSSRALKAALSCYGVPSSMLTIMEFGGPRSSDGGTTKFSFEDRTAAINISGSQSILVPWKEYSETSDYPNCVEIRVNSDTKQNQTFISSSLWSVGIDYLYGKQGQLKLTVSDSGTSYSILSDPFPFYNDEYTQVIVTKTGNSFEVYGKEAFQGRIRSEVSASLEVENHIWQTDTTLRIGGDTLTGSVDEFRYWTTPLSESRMDNHTLMPDAIDGNHHSSSTEDLIYRLDFEYPKDRSSDGDIYIKNVSINEGYGEPFATASGFDSITDYPYHYTTYERTVTANVPSSGFSVSQKFRLEEQEGLNESIDTGLSLSHRERSTKKSFDTSPVDSNRLGLFFSPIKEINMDILKSIGQFELDQYIGDYGDLYKDEYRDLRILRNYYFERYDLNLYEYIQLVRYIDQSLFEVLESLVPARAIVTSGLLIEPHILERNKIKETKATAVDFGSKFQDGVIDAQEALELAMVPITQWPADLKLKKQIKLSGLQNQYDSFIETLGPDFSGNYDDLIAEVKELNPDFSGDIQDLVSTMKDISPTFISTVDLVDGTITDSKVVDKLIKQFEALGGQEQIGVDSRNLKNGLAGITAKNGYAYITKLDGRGNLIKEHKQVFIVEEEFTIKEPQLINSLDTSLGYQDVDVTKTRKVVVFADIGDNGPTIGGNIKSVIRANSNGGNLFGNTFGSANLGEKYGGRSFRKISRQTSRTTLDGKSPVETFCTNPNILKVSDTQRGAGEPILEVDVK